MELIKTKQDVSKKNILLTIAYDGSCFHGWQKQPKSRTVQGELEVALSRTFGTATKIDGASRTDAGVHAYGQKATFQCGKNIPIEKLCPILNNSLSHGKIFHERVQGDIKIVNVEEVGTGLHARFDSVGKKYVYKIINAEEKDLFSRNYYYQIAKKLNVEKMIDAAQYIVGNKDFKSFQTLGGTPREITVRTIYDLCINEKKVYNSLGQQDREIRIEITGNGFLYNMVRIIVGTLVEVGLNRIQPNELEKIIESRNRDNAGHTAPPNGLYLAQVYYDSDQIKIDKE